MSEQQQEFTDFEINVDLTEKKEWNGEQAPLVDPGDYSLKVMNITQEQGPKAPYLKVTFEVQDEGAFKGFTVWQNYSMSDKAIGRVKSLMLACRTRLDKIVASEFLGQTILGTVVHTEGEQRSDEQGNPLPIKIFCNVQNERALAEPEPAPTKTAAPPVKAKPVAGGAPRRA